MREAHRLCKLADMVNDYKSHADQEKHLGLSQNRTKTVEKKSNPLQKED